MPASYGPEQILAAISGIESGGNYKARSKSSSASGKYQWIKSTWNNYGGYAEAWMAPPEVQERRAVEDITRKLRQYGGDVRSAIMSWFLPSAVGNERVANAVPAGNRISPNQYADKVLARLTGAKNSRKNSAGGDPAIEYGAEVDATPDRPDEWGTMEGQLANLLAALSVPGLETAKFGQ